MVFSFPTETVAEGMVEFVVPRLKAFVSKPSDYAPSKAPVFYNPSMELNRDLAVLAVLALQRLANHELTACEPLTGSGVRGVRLAREVNRLRKVVINDISNEAYQLARFNAELNGVMGKVSIRNKDANFLLSRFAAPKRRFDYIDVDPFGSPMPYVDSALRATRKGGLLALTSTDLAPLCGVHPKACLRKYGGNPLRTEYCHELALRLLAGALARSAAKYDISVEVVFTYSSKHYIRLYASIDHGAKKSDASLRNIGYIRHCFSCFHREPAAGIYIGHLESRCPKCGNKINIAGPLWIGKIVNRDFAILMEVEAKAKVFTHKKEIRRLLNLLKDEADAPITYYRVDRICDKLGWPVPSTGKVINHLRKLGHQTVPTHFKKHGIKTAASSEVVKEIVRMYGQ